MGSKITIIIPTYNRANLINSIFESVSNQSYKNLEIIFVNDGSKDNTNVVLENLALKDNRVKIVNKSNGGLSDARNAGLKIASGEYVFFIDDDDDVPNDYIESFMSSDADLVIDSYSRRRCENQLIKVDFPTCKLDNSDSTLRYLFTEMQNYPYCFFSVGKRYRMDIIREHSLSFGKQYTIGEDRPFVMEYIRHIKSAEFTNNHKYIIQEPVGTYRLSKGEKSLIRHWGTFKIHYSELKDFAESESMPEIAAYADNLIVSKFIEYLLFPLNFNHSDFKEIKQDALPFLLSLPIDIRNIRRKKDRIIYRLLSSIGLNGTLTLLKLKRLI